EEFGARAFAPQFAQGVDRVGRAAALQLAVVDHDFRNALESDPRHFDAMPRGRERARLVPRVAGGENTQFVEAQLFDGDLRQGAMRAMRRVERAAEHAQLHGVKPSPWAPGTSGT